MSKPSHAFHEGDRVRALSRPDFPTGTVAKILDAGYILVRWDGDVLETAHHTRLIRVTPSPAT